MNPSQILASLARAVRWHRRALAALVAGCAVLLGLTALTPEASGTVTVLVASDDLPAGHRLSADDLLAAPYPAPLVPDLSTGEAPELAGRVLTAPVSRGTPVTMRSVVSAKLTPGKGELLVPVPLADPAVLAMVQVGDLVTVVAPGQEGQPVTVASRVRVAALPGSTDGAGLDGTGSRALLVVAADQATASRLAAFSTGQGLGIALG